MYVRNYQKLYRSISFIKIFYVNHLALFRKQTVMFRIFFKLKYEKKMLVYENISYLMENNFLIYYF